MAEKKNQKSNQEKEVENQVNKIWRQFGSDTRRMKIDPSKADCLVPMLQTALQRQKEVLHPSRIDEFTWKAIRDLTVSQIDEAFGLAEEKPGSEKLQPWPPRNMIPMDIPADCLTSIQRAKKYMAYSFPNEAAARVVIDVVLFSILDQVMDGHCDVSGTWPLHIQMETVLESNLVTVKGEDQRFRGASDYTLWYGKGDGPEKAINLVVIEAKATEPRGRCETGDEQALGYMACVHQERRLQPGRSATVYGAVTNGREWRFIRINEEGKYNFHSEFTTKSGEHGSETGYAKIATLLGFIMGQAMILSPYTSRIHSKETSREDDAPIPDDYGLC